MVKRTGFINECGFEGNEVGMMLWAYEVRMRQSGGYRFDRKS